ncbi:MAG: hypothetical protein MJE12_26105, partial [Alphaproteobacteria bacterium]|nr:hypothetical protein [Alphaproteobacteria bacterium]
TTQAGSPHSAMLMRPGDREWVRTYEVDERIHAVVKAGREDAKYGAPYGPKSAASATEPEAERIAS